MNRHILKFSFIILVFFQVNNVFAWEGMPMPRLHVEGRYLKDPHGNIINLHGFAQTYSPWFNEQGTQWNGHDVEGCLNYNQGVIDGIMDAGWKVNFLRLHMDPHWSWIPGCQGRYEGEECFSEELFIKYLDEVFVPMAEYAVSKGLYVVMRPPGVSPEVIEVGGVYHEYLIKVWGIVSQHPTLKNHPNIMFELANEPIDIIGTDGTRGAGSQAHFDNLKIYFQAIVDTIRASADNIIWVPGLGYQSLYSGYANNPIEGENIGYAVHVYPGWFNSGQGYEPFQNGWNNQVQPVADFAPVIVTEMDWAPAKYNASWGKDITGTAGGNGFGANFKKITDDCGNVSWLIFTGPDLLDDFTGVPPAEGEGYTLLNDPEACPWPTYHWYQHYADEFEPRPEFENRSISDNGDSTFSNPVINGDFPAPLMVRDGDTYYLVSINQNIMPDTTILESKDLVNWEYSEVLAENIPLDDILLVDNADIHSGSLVMTQKGEWWAMVSYDKGPFGRFPHLLPVTLNGSDTLVNETFKDSVNILKPDVGRDYAEKALRTNDVFQHDIISPQWGWKNFSDSSGWSLLDREGYMRLKTTSVTDSIHKAQNILSQRILAYPSDLDHSYATIRMEIDSMLEGDVAGLSVFQDTFSYIGVQVIGGEKKMVTFLNNGIQTGPTLNDSIIYLRALAGYNTDSVSFYYSIDNSTYTKLGDNIKLDNTPSLFSGNRFGIFNYATVQIGGYVDIDWFSTENTFTGDKYYKSMVLTGLHAQEGDSLTIQSGSTGSLTIMAEFSDGHTENVTGKVEIVNPNTSVASMTNGIVKAGISGNVTITVRYSSELGETDSTIVTIIVPNRNPFLRNEAEIFFEQSGIQSEGSSDEGGGSDIGFIENGDWIWYTSLDFETAALSFDARVASNAGGGNIELRLDSLTGDLIGTCDVPGTGGWQTWQTMSCNITETTGVHDLYLVFKGGGGFLFNINWWQFNVDSVETEEPVNVSYGNFDPEPYCIIGPNNNTWLKATLPGDVITIYNQLGQKISTMHANSDITELKTLNGFIIIKVQRKQQTFIIKYII